LAAFDEARKHKESLLLLDDVDGMVDHVRTAGTMTWNSQQWSALRLLMRRRQPAGHRMLVLATAGSHVVADFPQIAEMFNLVIEVPALREADAFAAVLRETAAFTTVRAEAAAVLAVDAEAPLGIKTLLAAIDMAQDVVASSGGGRDGEEEGPDRDGAGAGQGDGEGDVEGEGAGGEGRGGTKAGTSGGGGGGGGGIEGGR